MVRVRTIPKAVEEIKKKDPESEINKWMLRNWVKSGVLPTVATTGTKVLINMDHLEEFLGGERLR